jgi:hypothetical protein
MKKLLGVTKRMLAQVEAVTGKPVQFLRDEHLPILSTLQLARDGAPCHVLRYKPTDSPLDYLIVFQASFALRLYDNPPDGRFDFTETGQASTDINQLLTVGAALDTESQRVLPVFARMVEEWAMMTLRSMPVGFRIDTEIAKTMPDLREQQAESIKGQLEKNLPILSFSKGRLTVPHQLLAMPAAYAYFAETLLGKSGQTIPYDALGLSEPAAALLGELDASTPDGTTDRALTDRCARHLGMTNWYQWVPYKS